MRRRRKRPGIGRTRLSSLIRRDKSRFLNASVQASQVSHKKNERKRSFLYLNMAGDEGFEPPNVGTRTRCLTTWRIPKIIRAYYCITAICFCLDSRHICR